MSNPLDDIRIRMGMEAVLNMRQERLEAGDEQIGWKIGFGTAEGMKRLHIEAPLVGFLTKSIVVTSGETVSIADWQKPVAEPEIAIYIGKDVPSGANRAAVKKAIAAIGPAIELADIDFPPIHPATILAGNIYNRYVIFGDKDESRKGGGLDGLTGHILRDGIKTETISDLQAQTGDILELARHTADLLAALDIGLRAGDVVITGSIVPPIQIEKGEEISYTLEPLQTISVKLH